MQKFRKGDVVRVQAFVEYDVAESDGLVFLKFVGDHQTVSLLRDRANIDLIVPVFDVGDSVQWDEHGRGIIHAINDGHAWIGMDSGDYCTRLLTMIERAEESTDA